MVGVTGNRFGIKFAWGTGGDSGPALQGLAKAFYNPHLFDVMPFKSKYNNKGEDAITAYFIPAYTMVNLPGITDSRGYCDPELGKKYYEKDNTKNTLPYYQMKDTEVSETDILKFFHSFNRDLSEILLINLVVLELVKR